MFLVNAGHIVITPVHPLPLAGFADRKQNFDGISDDLEINLIAIKDGGKLYLLYSVDTLFVPEDFLQAVIAGFGSTYPLDESSIWMCASHTHFAPSLDAEKPNMGICDEGYYNYVKERLLSLTAQVLQGTFSEAYISYSYGEAELNVNRRKKLLRLDNGKLTRKTLILPDYKGSKDPSLHAIRFMSLNGEILAFLWSYACHPVNAYKKNHISAEYIGVVRKKLREHTDREGLVVGFFQGFAGNLKADITAVTHTRQEDSIRYLLQLWPKHVSFPSAQAYIDWTNLLWNQVKAVITTEESLRVESNIKCSIHKIALGNIIGNREGSTIIFRKMSFGKDLAFVSINAEVVTEYTDVVRQLIPETYVIGVAYTEATRTYLPTDHMLAEKGYEVEGFKPLFSIEGDFKYPLTPKIADAITALNNG